MMATVNVDIQNKGAGDRPKTVNGNVALTGHQSTDLIVKHPLENTWALWYFKNDKSKEWSENQRLVSTFSTVEDFWALYNYIVPASGLAAGCDYSVFKEGISPMWEDKRNRDGGRWVINFDRRRRADLDRFWMDTLLCLIGEQFGAYGDDVCGAVVNLRPKGDKIAVWTRDCNNSDSNLLIGKTLKNQLRANFELEYQSHTDTMVKNSSTAKSRYVI